MKQRKETPKSSDLPIYLFKQGNNQEAYRYFGAHLCEENGEAGAVFRVWAPHAKAVSIVGDFNSCRRRTVCAPVCDEEYLEKMTPDFWLPDLTDEKKNGWAFYLHYMKDAADGMIGVCHKTGEIGHLFVTEAARGKGYGAKMLDFARKKLPEHDHPTMGVINTNTRAIALYKRMGWRLTGTVLHRYDPAEEGTFAAVYCEELEMQYRG